MFDTPVYPGPYKMTMGLEPMNPADWMEIDSLYEEEMQLRREILRDKRHLVIACQPCVSLIPLCTSCAWCHVSANMLQVRMAVNSCSLVSVRSQLSKL